MQKLKRYKSMGIAIDPHTCRDRDDAIWVERKGDSHLLSVSIADICNYTRIGSGSDEEARVKGFSRYKKNPIFDNPLFDRKIVENASLTQAEGNRAITVQANVDVEGKITNIEIFRSSLTVALATNYDDANLLFGKNDPIGVVLNCARDVARVLRKRRGKTSEIRNTAAIVAELMIFANGQVAHFMRTNGLAGIYRNQIHSSSEDQGYGKRGFYCASSLGHDALNLDDYTHFTSPIRRYIDVIVHRILLGILDGNPSVYEKSVLADIANGINKIEKEIKDHRMELKRKKSKPERLKPLEDRIEDAIARNACSLKLENELSKNLSGGSLTDISLVALMFCPPGSVLAKFKVDAARQILRRTSDPMRILEIYAELDDWSGIRVRLKKSQGIWPHSCELIGVKETRSPELSGSISAPSLYAARRNAAIVLIAKLSGLEIRDSDLSPQLSAVEVLHNLNERKLLALSYEFTTTDSGKHVCALKIQTNEVSIDLTATASTKAIAKRIVSLDALDELIYRKIV